MLAGTATSNCSVLIQDQLGTIAGFHYMSVCGPTGTGEISGEEFTEQRAIASSGDTAWFVRKMLEPRHE